MLWWKAAFGKYSKSGCKFPKWHSNLHYYHFILEYGVPLLVYTGSFEKAHRFLCKLPYQRTGMRLKNLWELLMLRVVLADRVMLMKTTLESIAKQRNRLSWLDRDGDESGDTAESPLPPLPPTLQKQDNVLEQLVEEYFPNDYADGTDGPPRSSFDHNGYLNIPEG